MKKKIMITTRGRVLTSRGFIITPTRPFMEDTRYFLRMIAKGANVVEILKDGTQVVLTEQNFDKDNSQIEEVVKEKVVEPTPEPITEKTIITKNLSRKERKQAEYARRANAEKEQSKHVKNSTPVQNTDVEDAVEAE